MNVFVPGGTGFLGSHVIKKLETLHIPHFSSSLTKGTDFRDYKQTKKIFKEHEFDTVINCAAFVGGISWGYEKPGEMYLNNIQMNTNLMEAARRYKIKRFINPIANCSYPGQLTQEFSEDQWWDGPLHDSVLTYGFVRKASWVQAWSYNKQYGMEFVNLLLPNMYGPGDHFDEKRSHALGALIKKICDGKLEGKKEIVIWGSGTPIREWLYIEDAVDALIRSMGMVSPTIEPINIGVGKGISVKDMAFLIKEIAGYTGDLTFDLSKPDGAPYKTMNNKKMREYFMGWVPPTSLRDGITKTVTWYMKNKQK